RNRRDRATMLNVAVEQGWLVADIHQNSDGKFLNGARLNSLKAVADGKWHHFALLRDNLGNVTLYVDGQWQDGKADEGARGRLTTDLRALGRDLLRASPGFQGSIDEFCIFRRKLTDNEINKLAGKKGF